MFFTRSQEDDNLTKHRSEKLKKIIRNMPHKQPKQPNT